MVSEVISPVPHIIQPIHLLEGGFSAQPIRVCIRNIWDIKFQHQCNTYKCIGFICYDYQEVLLEGRLSTRNHTPGQSLLTEGDTYEFTGFIVLPNPREQKLTQLPYTIRINQRSTVLNVSTIDPIISRPPLSPKNYKSLLRLSTTTSCLPDVIGQIIYMPDISLPNQGSIAKITFALMLSNSKVVRITLWNDPAKDFSLLQSKKDRKLRIVIVTSLIPKFFLGRLELSSTPATAFYFSKRIDHIKNYATQI